jgi:hypothetical protein
MAIQNPKTPSDDWSESINSEQDSDASEQAQTVAEEALNRGTDMAEDSEKVSSGDELDDIQDLVDHINQMESSGRIDMSAYRGEPNHDDDIDKYGRASDTDEGEVDES